MIQYFAKVRNVDLYRKALEFIWLTQEKQPK